MLVRTISEVLALSFKRIQFTPDLMPSDVTGTNIMVKEEGRSSFRFEKGPIFANLVLADEINRATPKTQSALLEAMQEHTVTVGTESHRLEEPFLVLATQNPIEQEGTYPLPEAQLDRFLFKILVPFPDKEELRGIVNLTEGTDKPVITSIMSGEELLAARSLVAQIPIADAVMDYILDLVMATHKENPYIREGASPRAAQAIIRTARARAFMEGRFNVAFEDVKSVAYPVLRHITQILGTQQYARLRFGIGNDFARGGQVDFVLGGFTPEEREKMDERIGMAADFVRIFALEGIQRAMNKYNGK